MTFNLINSSLCISSALLIFTACNNEDSSIPNTLSENEKKEGWELLFDGKTADQWHIYNKGNAPSAWLISNGGIYCNPDSEADKGDLVTNKEYTNYELKFDWKLEKEGNSGVFINVIERADIPSTWNSGPEYQLLEDSHPDFDKPLKRAGTLYTFSPQKNFVNTKTSGQWNHSRIIQNKGKIEFYLNDVKTAEMDLNSDNWKKSITTSNFKDFPEFGKHVKGRIALQDWSRGVTFRNIKIKEL